LTLIQRPLKQHASTHLPPLPKSRRSQLGGALVEPRDTGAVRSLRRALPCGGQLVQRHCCIHVCATGCGGRRSFGDAVFLGRVRCRIPGAGLQPLGLAKGGSLADLQRCCEHRQQSKLGSRFARVVDFLGPMKAAHVFTVRTRFRGLRFRAGSSLLPKRVQRTCRPHSPQSPTAVSPA